jgi:glucose uptake protein
VANFVSAGVVGVAVSWGSGNGAPVIVALCGIFLWKEFKNGGSKAKTLIALSMALYVAGVVAVAISYQVR